MKKLLALLALAVLSGCGVVDTGNVGVRTTYGTVDMTPVLPGLYVAILSHVDEFTAKEFNLDLDKMTPKAKDNLTLQDMEVLVYYKTNANKIPGLVVKYSGQSTYSRGLHYPGAYLVESVAKGIVYDEVIKYDSLDVQNERDKIAASMMIALQKSLDTTDPQTFTVTRVVIKSVKTDPAIEAAIQRNVNNQKILEAKIKEVEIAKKDAEIEVAKAHGVASANQIINGTLTKEYLQHEANLALLKFAEKGNSNTVIMPYGMGQSPLLTLSADKVVK